MRAHQAGERADSQAEQTGRQRRQQRQEPRAVPEETCARHGRSQPHQELGGQTSQERDEQPQQRCRQQRLPVTSCHHLAPSAEAHRTQAHGCGERCHGGPPGPRDRHHLDVPDAAQPEDRQGQGQQALGSRRKGLDSARVAQRRAPVQGARHDPGRVHEERAQGHQERAPQRLPATTGHAREGEDGRHHSAHSAERGEGHPQHHGRERRLAGPRAARGVVQPGQRRVGEEQRPVADPETLGDIGIPDVEGGGRELRGQVVRRHESARTRPRQHQGAEEQQLLQQLPGNELVEERDHGIGRHRPRKTRAQSQEVGPEAEVGDEHHVVAQDEARTQHWSQDDQAEHPGPGARDEELAGAHESSAPGQAGPGTERIPRLAAPSTKHAVAEHLAPPDTPGVVPSPV